MTEEQPSQELQTTEEQSILDLHNLKEQLKNKQKIRLIFPYEKNPEVKKLGAKWDSVNKIWYYPSINGVVPDELKPYKAHKIFVEFDDKEFLKPILKSMKFDKNEKVWIVNQEDYNKFMKLGS